MSTVCKFRYLSAAVLALTAVGLMIDGHILVGVLCLISAVLFLPVLYQRLLIESKEIQIVSPALFVVITLFSFMVLQAIPEPYDAPLKTVYTDTYVSVTTARSESTITTLSTLPTRGNTVYRTASGKRYHVSASCGGEEVYEVTLDQAVDAGLTPCKKCAGG